MHFLKPYTLGHNFFRIIFVSSKMFKTFLAKKNLFRYYYSISVYIMYQSRDFLLVKFVFFNLNIAKRYNFFTQFMYENKFLNFFLFNNASLTSAKLAFCSKFKASLLLIPLVIQENHHRLCLK